MSTGAAPGSKHIDTVEVRGVEDDETAFVHITEDPKPTFQGEPSRNPGLRKPVLERKVGEEPVEDRSFVDGEEIWTSAATGKRYKSVTLSILCK